MEFRGCSWGKSPTINLATMMDRIVSLLLASEEAEL